MTDRSDIASSAHESSPAFDMSAGESQITSEPEDLSDEYKNYLLTNEYDDSFVKLSLDSIEARKIRMVYSS